MKLCVRTWKSVLVLLVLLVGAVHAADATPAPVQQNSRKGRFRWERDHWFEAQFTDHPKFACAKAGYPRGEKFLGYDRKFLLKTPESPRSLFCALRGTEKDLQAMVRAVGLETSVRQLRRGGRLLQLSSPQVRCVSRPRLLATLFDLVVVAGRPPHHEAWCLLVRAPASPHAAYEPRFPQPTGGALAIRFRSEHVPDVVCSPDLRRDDDSDGDDDADFFIQGFLQRWSDYFRCNFQRSNNTTGPSARTLLLSVVLERGLGSGTYRGRPVTWLPAHTCREACPQRAPRPDDLVRLTGAYEDDYGVDVTVTSPLGRTATCDVPDRAVFHEGGPSFQMEVVFPNQPHLVCHSHRVPMGEDVDGTDFYFIVRLNLEFKGSRIFRCKVKNGERLGGDAGVENLLLDLAQQSGLQVSGEDVELGRAVPSVLLGPTTCEVAPPFGYLHHFQVHVASEQETHHCAFGQTDWRDERRKQDESYGGTNSYSRIY